MAQILKNNVSGVLGLALGAAETSMTLLDASSFPAPPDGDFYLLTLIGLNDNGQEASWEIVKVTGKASNTLTVVRAQEGTPAAAWPVATMVQLRLTAGSVITPDALGGKEASGTAAAAMSAHTSAADPHGQYLPKAGGTMTGAITFAPAQTWPTFNQSTTGNAATATKLKTARTINGVSFDGSANITINAVDSTAREPSITAGTTAQYWRGDKSWRDFFTDVRAATLTGLGTATNAVISATDTVLGALGKLQKQVSDNLATLTSHTGSTSNPHSVTKAQVGLGNVDNTSDADKPVSTATQTALNLKANAATTVEQSDIGTGPNEIPLNQHLGDMAFQNASALVIKPAASATPQQVGSMVFQLTNDTQLVVKVKGSDGTVRSATLTLA